MNDRELLELAAKAAGLSSAEWKEYINDPPTMVLRYEQPIDGVTGYDWNPLTDDGDALRLAVSLKLDVTFLNGYREVMVADYNGDNDACEPYQDDMSAATRRAIVRAAAEIGKAMP